MFYSKKVNPFALGCCPPLLLAAPLMRCSSSILAQTFTQHLDRLPLLLQTRLVLAEEEFGADWIHRCLHTSYRSWAHLGLWSLKSWFLQGHMGYRIWDLRLVRVTSNICVHICSLPFSSLPLKCSPWAFLQMNLCYLCQRSSWSWLLSSKLHLRSKYKAVFSYPNQGLFFMKCHYKPPSALFLMKT